MSCKSLTTIHNNVFFYIYTQYIHHTKGAKNGDEDAEKEDKMLKGDVIFLFK